MSISSRLLQAAILVTIPAFALSQTPPSIEERVNRVQDGLLPPVIIKGESAARKLADEMAAMHVPGVSIAVIHGGKIEWARGFGVTRLGGPPVTAETLFQAASISKPVTAIAVLRLVQSGKINLDADVNQYLKSWRVPSNTLTEKTKITVRELLTHTAGLTVHGFAGYAASEPVPTLLQVLNGQKPANSNLIRVDVEPGTVWRYSGGGYVVLQQLLQDLTSEPFARLMKDTVVIPLGMTHSTYEQPLPTSRLAEVALPYRDDGTPVAGGPHTYPEMAPAGLWTTPSDLASYALEVQRSLAGTSSRVLSKVTVQQMLTPGMNSWGLGPEIGGDATNRYFTHGGANEGYRCQLVVHNKGGVLTVTHNGPQLFLELAEQPKIRFYPENDRSYFSTANGATVIFDVDSKGKATQIIIHLPNGNTLLAKRIVAN